MPFRHPAAVRREAVGLVRQGLLPAAAARRVGVNPTTVYVWLHADAPDLVGPPDVRCWRCRPETAADHTAYAYLLGLYLGDGWLTCTPKGYWCLSVACCATWPGLQQECEDAMRNVLATSVCRVRRKGCQEVKAYSKHWSCLFPQHGTGKKHARPIRFEVWQQAVVSEHPGELLRGLFHSDGWRGQNVAVKRVGGTVVRYRYPRYEFTNLSADIRGICTDARDQLGIAWRPVGAYVISVARREAVASLDEHVGPKY